MVRRRILVIILFAYFAPVFGQQALWVGKCVGVTDGDTIAVIHDGKAEKIRLDGIDCPESNQAFGTRAKQFTSGMVFGKQVTVYPKEKDKYGHTIAQIFTDDGKCLNRELVYSGFAWWYKQYSNDVNLERRQADAQKAKRGLWSDPHALPPWEFRHNPEKARLAVELPPETPETPRPPPPDTYHSVNESMALLYPDHKAALPPITTDAPRAVQTNAVQPSAQPSAGQMLLAAPAASPIPITVTPSEVPYAPAQSVAPTYAPAPSNGTQANSATVYVTATGKKYHSAGCRYLSKSMIPMSLPQAAQRYEPCSVCNPPVLNQPYAPVVTPSASQVQSYAPRQSQPNTPSTDNFSGDYTPRGFKIYTGPRGGRYHISKNGNKVYERRR